MKKIKNKYTLLLFGICILGSLYHISFFHLNEVLKVADSFAYLQLGSFLRDFSSQGLGNGWFGFVYSGCISLITLVFSDIFFAGKVTNIILLNISAVLVWKLSRIILSPLSSCLVIVLFFLSPSFLHFNIHILSENIYLPLFVGSVLLLYKISRSIEQGNTIKIYPLSIMLGCIIGLMYLTRAEAFIYLGSIGLLATIFLFQKKLSTKHFISLGSIFLLSFFIFVSPYIYHLHTLSGEWGLTNKGASNLRQAELRGIEQMDDAGFEQAVAELTADNTQLISGFAGGMPYKKPQIQGSIYNMFLDDPQTFMIRIFQNQGKLFSKNLPEIFLGEAPKLYYSDDIRFSNIIYLLYLSLPCFILLYGIVQLYKKETLFLQVHGVFFLLACLFFTLFFTLNRYFIIFLPFLLITFIYGATQCKVWWRYFLIIQCTTIFLLSTNVYYNSEKHKDEYYALKKEAGLWLHNYMKDDTTGDIRIMERFPIVTYYTGAKYRFITPYTDTLDDIYEYAILNDMDILVVDSMDFLSYRPKLGHLLSETPSQFFLLKEFQNTSGQKVILYALKK